MGRYPAQPLEDKLAWMRARQERRQAKETRRIEPGAAAPLPPDKPLLPRMLRLNQVAEALGVSRQTVKRWFLRRAIIVQGERNTVVLIPQQALDDWIREHGPSSR